MDIVTLGAALNGSKKYTDQVTQSLMGGVHYRGSVSYYDGLPANPTEGDSYTVKYAGSSGSVEDGTEYTWGYDTDTNDYAWISFSKNAYSKAETDVLLGSKQNTIDSNHTLDGSLVSPLTGYEKSETGGQDVSPNDSLNGALGKVEKRVSDNETNISNQQDTIANGGNGYAIINGIRVYVSSTAPTGDIPDGSVGVGW